MHSEGIHITKNSITVTLQFVNEFAEKDLPLEHAKTITLCNKASVEKHLASPQWQKTRQVTSHLAKLSEKPATVSRGLATQSAYLNKKPIV